MECVSQQVERSHLNFTVCMASNGHEVWALSSEESAPGSPWGWTKLAAPIKERGVVSSEGSQGVTDALH